VLQKVVVYARDTTGRESTSRLGGSETRDSSVWQTDGRENATRFLGRLHLSVFIPISSGDPQHESGSDRIGY